MPSVLSNTNGLQPIWLLSPLITLMNGLSKTTHKAIILYDSVVRKIWRKENTR